MTDETESADFSPVPGASVRDEPTSSHYPQSRNTIAKSVCAVIEMVAAGHPFDSSAGEDGPTQGGGGDAGHDEDEQIIRNPQQSQLESSSTVDNGNQHNLPNNNAYENWRVDGESIGNTTNNNRNNNNSKNDTGDELAWKIITVVLKGWFIIWILFAFLVISAEIFSPNNKTKVHGTKNIVTVEDEQLYLEISENIISACSYSNLDTEGGREECQALCQNHMCCFIEEDEDAQFQLHSYGCQSDAEKMCAAYAGCESLVVSEDDAIIYDADGVDVFAADGDDDDANGSQAQSAMTGEQSQSPNTSVTISVSNSTSSSVLQLIQQVITSVCSNDNLHTRHGMLECASICNPSMCCFDRSEIEFLNPKMDLILKMEGITNEIVDRSAMGTCMNEEEQVDDGALPNHFCQVHEGCKNILLLGAPSAITVKKRQSSSGDPFVFTNIGVYDKNSAVAMSTVTSEQQRTLETVCILFGLMIGLTGYLLVFKRSETSAAIEMALSGGIRTNEGETVDLV
ncbi:hypothetical protein ACHAXR_006219 [Thalassiosira sp. AJA248-18]